MPLAIKLSDDLMTRLGATNEADVMAKLDSLIGGEVALRTRAEKAELAAVADAATIQKQGTDFAALSARVDALERITQPSADTVAATSRAEASKVVMEALGKAGIRPLAAAPANPDGSEADETPPTFAEIVALKVAAGTSKADAIKQAVSENPEAYAAWRKSGLSL